MKNLVSVVVRILLYVQRKICLFWLISFFWFSLVEYDSNLHVVCL